MQYPPVYQMPSAAGFSMPPIAEHYVPQQNQHFQPVHQIKTIPNNMRVLQVLPMLMQTIPNNMRVLQVLPMPFNWYQNHNQN